MSEPSDLDRINRRLAEIDALLDGPARQPGPQHFALLIERDSLRSRASEYRTGRDASRSVAELEAELIALKRQLQKSVAARTGYITAKGGSNQGPATGAWVKLAAQTRAAGDFQRLQARIGEIEDELSRRRESQP